MDNESETLIISGEPEIGDEFYEKIEAPKFVDLTAPDPFQPGEDRSWFCLRVGCDQNHDEELDSEAIYKNFVLRVMAARSPNVRLRKALCRKGLDVKCPRTVPAKLSKSRVTRTALISSISKRIVDTKVKVKPLSKKNATPKGNNTKRASIIGKALTTPRSKKQLAKPEAFRSVRNPRITANAASNSRAVAKTLVFDSPKKDLKTLCAGMKKLEITSGKKQALGYNRPLPSETSRKQFRGREVKSRVFDGLNYHKEKTQHAKASRCLEKNKKENDLEKNEGPVCSEKAVNDVYDIEIDEKTADTSARVSSTTASGDGNMSEENSTATEIPRPLSNEKNVKVLTDAMSSEDDVSRFQPPEETAERDDKGQALNSDNNGNKSEEMESDDKENALASDDSRKLDAQTSRVEHKLFGKHKNLKGNQENAAEKSKRSKESSTPNSNGAQCLKLKKPKPTNPKPFRLRTDERGILKEANFEKKQCSTTPLCETATVLKVTGDNSQEKHQNAPLRHTISSKQKLVASLQKTGQDNSAPKSENNTRKSKSPSVRKILRLKEEALGENEMAMVKTGKLGTIKETSPTILKATATLRQRENGALMVTKGSVTPASRKSKTVPKEPNFHSIHTPKSCTKRVMT